MKKIIIIALIIIVAIIAGYRLMSVRNNKLSQNASAYTINEVSVNIVDIKINNASFTINCTGTLAPNHELDVAAETQGKITSLNLKLGQSVAAGTVLATIDNTLRKISLESAKIDLNKAKREYERTKNLLSSGSSTQQDLDNSLSTLETAQSKLDEAEKQLNYTKIISSISGIVTKKNIELGTYVNTGTAIASIVDIMKLKVKIYVTESNIYYLKQGNSAKITTDVYTGKSFEGRISYISPNADSSHNYLVEIEMNNSTKYPLKAGTFVNVSFDINMNKEAMYIPRQALQGSIKDAKVYVVADGKAKLKKIEVGIGNDQYLEVISGLNSNEKIITSGQVNLSDGKAIKIINN